MVNQPQIPCPGGFIYNVRAGDTLFGIAARFGVTLESLLAANPDLDPAQNPGADPNRLVVGQPVCIPVPPAACPGTIYAIQAGDTLFALANRFGTTVEAILAANPGIDPNRLTIGQRICIPVTAPPACPGFTYTIQAGDTLFSLAARFNTTVQAIINANPGIDPNRLAIGQRICIPVPAPECPGFIYTIQSGDTLFALAQRYGTTVQAILAANPGLDPASLQVARRICIPMPAGEASTADTES